MNSIVSKGKDINQAITIGLDLLEAKKSEVSIEIIQNETKGFLGIGSQEAIVKITRNNGTNKQKDIDPFDLVEKIASELPGQQSYIEEYKEDNSEDTQLESLEGKVWVEDGRLYCKSSPIRFPMVTIPDGVKLYKNGRQVSERTAVISEKDSYEIKVEDVEQDTKWSISMDQQRLKVMLDVEPGYKVKRKVIDLDPAHHLELVVEETSEVENNLSYATVLQELESLRVKHGFNQSEISKAMEVMQPATFEIATGIKPKPGKDGWLDIKVDVDTSEGLKEKKDGSVDFREIKTIPSVERGQVLAVVHPPIPGEMGYTVTNEPLPAKQTFPLIIKTGKGVMSVDNTIVATESGRPFIEKRGQLVKISIMQKLTHIGNVDLTSGNIRFLGDVEVVGEVKGTMSVEADGDIIIHQTVNMATLTAAGAVITYGNIIGSEISAGKNNMLVAELGHLLGIMNQHVSNLIGVIQQLSVSPAFKSSDLSRAGIQPLIQILLEKKFKALPPIAKKYVDIVRMSEDYLQEDDWREVATWLHKLFLSLTNEIASIDTIMGLSQKMMHLHELSQTPIEPDSYITISNSLNSSLYCSGNIIIIGQGCINTKVHAGGSLKIMGILRGGEVYGRLGVEINEVGAESGTSTLISVPDDQQIHIKKVMEGSSIKIGNSKYTFTNTRYNVTAYLSEDGRIVIH
ncbi:FapA family protein [Sporosarcina sp. 179-K 8C2 HS]|uniref:flagellar assembly protein A n=1 Tax=Sporosarcina sp. 179-K 8C2 HS TaxID=3142387 RepID=UPI0039A235C9